MELSVLYARLKNQYKFKYQTVFSARFDKQDEDGQVLDETEFFINLKINHNCTRRWSWQNCYQISIRTSNSSTKNERFRLEIR